MAPVASFSIDIDAPIATVWQAMVELQRYHEWNPFIVGVETADAIAHVGTRMLLDVRWGRGGGTRSPEMVSRLDAPAPAPGGGMHAQLDYVYLGLPARLGLVRGTRVQTVAQTAGGPTRYETREQFSGLMAAGVPLRKVQDGFERHGRALKQRAESMARAAGGRAAG